jgi:epoxyqueuosine reductase
MLEADDAELLDRFGRWYIPRRDPKYLRRNALIVLGNIADPKSASVRTAVAKATLDPDPIIRSHAVWAAARLGYTDLTPASDPDPIVQDEVAASPSVPSRAVAR